VEEDHHPTGRVGKCRGQGIGVRRYRLARHAHGHRLVERAALGLERVAAQAGDRRDHRAPARGRGERGRLTPGERRPGRHAERARSEPQAGVHAARDALVDRAGGHGAGSGGAERALRDRLVHVTDAAGGESQLVEAHRRQRSKLGLAHERMPP
jgi:hypothetical protein